MKIIVFLILSLVYSPLSFACAANPSSMVAIYPQRHFDNSDVVFLGKLISFEELMETKQIVTFSIQKTLKGPEHHTITIVNKLGSSCSRLFTKKGSSYYVFSKFDKAAGNYTLENTSSFVPLSMASKKNMLSKITHNKSLQSDP